MTSFAIKVFYDTFYFNYNNIINSRHYQEKGLDFD